MGWGDEGVMVIPNLGGFVFGRVNADFLRLALVNVAWKLVAEI